MSIAKFFRITERGQACLNDLMEKTGSMNESEVIRAAIMEKYSRDCGNGMRPDKSLNFLPGRPKKTVEDKKYDEQLKIVDALDGEVIEDNGNKICKYKIYELVNPRLVEIFDQEIPVSLLTKLLIEKQYRPSKAECLKVLAKMKK